MYKLSVFGTKIQARKYESEQLIMGKLKAERNQELGGWPISDGKPAGYASFVFCTVYYSGPLSCAGGDKSTF